MDMKKFTKTIRRLMNKIHNLNNGHCVPSTGTGHCV